MDIVVGHHDTAEGRAALERAVALATEEGATLHLVHFSELPDQEEDPYRYVGARSEEEQQAEAFAERLRADGVRCEVHHVRDAHEPAEALLSVARAASADLIVIGMRRRSRVGKLVLGSTSQTILLGSDCPVLSVKPHRE